jgi:hypothetical protein
MGNVIDAEFGGHHAHDRYCASCDERFPHTATLCPRCGGALTLWARRAVIDRRRQRRRELLAIGGLVFAAVLVVAALLF